jgi:hypothetical protein
VDRFMLCFHSMTMTTCEWIYVQTFLTDLALDLADTPGEREFVLRRLLELQARIQFEQRALARPGASLTESCRRVVSPNMRNRG